MTKIEITAEHIAKGERMGKGYQCAISLALKEHFKLPFCHIGGDGVLELGKTMRGADVYVLPKRVVAWIDRFDRGEDVKPFTLRLGAAK